MDLDRLAKIYFHHNLKGKFYFRNNGKGCKKLVLLLIGYKRNLWDNVLLRLKRELTEEMDVCLISSGKYFKELDDMAIVNSWSYISTKKNNVCLIQNLAIKSFPNAELIFKLDEDIFLTEGTFKKLEEAMNKADSETPYVSGMCAPLLNINAYGYYRILERTNNLDRYKELFHKAPKMEAGTATLIESSNECAAFMWGVDGSIPQLDKLNKQFERGDQIYSICPIRLSIGCFVFKRSFWEEFKGFPVVVGNGMGLDETLIIGAGSALSRVMVVAENCVVGHLGYGRQGKFMNELYKSRPELFNE